MNAEIDISNVKLETERLILRAWEITDLDDFFEYASINGVGEKAGWEHHKSKDESYSEQGIETFCNFVNNKKITKSFKVYGAFEDNVLKGIIATDRRKRHINLFFVDKSSQGKGIGKELMRVVVNNNASSFSLLSNCFTSIISSPSII